MPQERPRLEKARRECWSPEQVRPGPSHEADAFSQPTDVGRTQAIDKIGRMQTALVCALSRKP